MGTESPVRGSGTILAVIVVEQSRGVRMIDPRHKDSAMGSGSFPRSLWAETANGQSFEKCQWYPKKKNKKQG